jgi:hypothetical protein
MFAGRLPRNFAIETSLFRAETRYTPRVDSEEFSCSEFAKDE